MGPKISRSPSIDPGVLDRGLAVERRRARRLAPLLSALTLSACASTPPMAARDPAPAQTAAAPSIPVVGFPLYLSHWDQHWYFWLPRHPTFESAEVMSSDRPGGGPPLVWVFFTERAGAKRQRHYINDQRLAAARAWTHREIRYAIKGGAGEARSLDVSLTDMDGQPIEITMDFDPGTPMNRTGRRGLTDQSGHSRDIHFLIFYRDMHARAPRGTMKIAGVNHAFLPEEPLGTYPARYTNSGNNYIGTIGYGRRHIPLAGLAVAPREGGGQGYTHRAAGNVSTVTADRAGALVESRQSVGPRAVFTRFSPALPPCRPGAPPAEARFSISLDIDPDIITGQATRRCEGETSILEFRPNAPAWAAAQPFSVRQSSPTGATIELESARLPD